ncbi:MAG: DUF4388 domain-containing protein [Planctomycetota bacterium]|nr:DUF4388 domain-containing protein [Planctomycetota bacterium]
MGFAGELATIGLAEVFQNLAFNKLTGTLSLEEGNKTAHVHFEAGVIRMVSMGANKPYDYAAIIGKSQVVPQKAFDAALKKRRRRTLKAALQAVAASFDEEAYDHVLASHVEEEVLLLFGWTHATFTFEERRADERLFDREQRDCTFGLDPQAVAMEAARRLDEWESISRHLGSEKEIFLPARGTENEEVTPQVALLIDLLDGVNDLGAVVEHMPQSKFEVMKCIADMVGSGQLVRATALHLRDLAVRASAAGEVNRATRHLEAALEREGGDLDIRRELVKLYEKSGHKNEAAREHKKLAFALTEMGDLDGALQAYERASVLVPHDTSSLEKIIEIHESRGEKEALIKAGRRLGEAFVAEALYDDALAVYKRLVKADEHSSALREALAEVYVKLKQPKKASAELMPMAERAYVRGAFNEALHHYRNIIRVDRGCDEAAERIDEIESGRIRLHRTMRRRQVVAASTGVVVALLLWQGGREWFGQQALHRIATASLGVEPQSEVDPSRINIMGRYATVCGDFPFTWAEARAEEALAILVLKELERLHGLVAVDPRSVEEDVRRIDAIRGFNPEVEQLWNDGRDRLLQILREQREATSAEG